MGGRCLIQCQPGILISSTCFVPMGIALLVPATCLELYASQFVLGAGCPGPGCSAGADKPWPWVIGMPLHLQRRAEETLRRSCIAAAQSSSAVAPVLWVG